MSKHLIAYLFLVIKIPDLPTTSLPALITLPMCVGQLKSTFINSGNVSETWSLIRSYRLIALDISSAISSGMAGIAVKYTESVSP